jgi:hypothetical protein
VALGPPHTSCAAAVADRPCALWLAILPACRRPSTAPNSFPPLAGPHLTTMSASAGRPCSAHGLPFSMTPPRVEFPPSLLRPPHHRGHRALPVVASQLMTEASKLPQQASNSCASPKTFTSPAIGFDRPPRRPAPKLSALPASSSFRERTAWPMDLPCRLPSYPREDSAGLGPFFPAQLGSHGTSRTYLLLASLQGRTRRRWRSPSFHLLSPRCVQQK